MTDNLSVYDDFTLEELSYNHARFTDLSIIKTWNVYPDYNLNFAVKLNLIFEGGNPKWECFEKLFSTFPSAMSFLRDSTKP